MMSAIIATSDTRIAAVYARKSTDDSDRSDEAGEMRTTLDSLLSSWERRRARQRTHDALRRRAEAGAVTGGQPYATRNVCDRCETPTVPRRTCECKATVRRVLHDEEAKVIL